MRRTVILIDNNRGHLKSLFDALLEDFEVTRISIGFSNTLRDTLPDFDSDEAVVLLNANLKFKEGDRRCERKGGKLLEHCIRLECRSLVPVVLTSYESWEHFKDNPHNSIVLEPGHYYCQYPPKIPKLVKILKEARPIYNEAALDEVIRSSCSLLSKIRTELHDIENSLAIQSNLEILRKKALARIGRLKKLVPSKYHEELLLLELEDGLRLLNSANEKEDIEDILKKFKSRIYPLLGE